jgi:hypothetical protein
VPGMGEGIGNRQLISNFRIEILCLKVPQVLDKDTCKYFRNKHPSDVIFILKIFQE